MTAAPPEPREAKDMATTDKKPKGVEVFVRLEETDKEHRLKHACTPPARWLGRKSLRSLLIRSSTPTSEQGPIHHMRAATLHSGATPAIAD